MARLSDQEQASAGTGRRQALIEAAFARIAASGLEGLRLRDVAAGAGIDHSTIHHYFATKQDLVTAVVDYATRQFWTTEPPAGNPLDELHHQLTRLARLIVDRPQLHIVVRELDLRARRDAAAHALIASREEGWRASLTRLFAEGARTYRWAPGVAPDTAAELVIAAVKGASLDPGHAVSVLRQLELLLVRDGPAGAVGAGRIDGTARE